jgi:hypothetical protein
MSDTEIRRDAAIKRATAAQQEADALTLRAAAEWIIQRMPKATSWTRQFQGYDDSPGGDWYVVSIRNGEGQQLLDPDREAEGYFEELQEIVNTIFEPGEHNEECTAAILPEHIQCTTCGAPATHLYASWDVRDGTISSLNGVGRWSPSCNSCDDPELTEPMEGQFRITAPLRMWIEL